MMLYLTGATSSITKSGNVPQQDTAKSLGGFVSSTPVPNGELNALFDLVSTYTKEKRRAETIAVALINNTEQYVKNVTMSLVVGNQSIASFKVAAVALNEELAMEHIPNRYAEPMMAEFHSADFQRAWFDMKIHTPANDGETITLLGVDVTVEEQGVDGTMRAFENAFEFDDGWCCKRYDENTLRFTRRDEWIAPKEPPTEITYETDGVFTATTTTPRNGAVNSVTIIDEDNNLAPGMGVGLWIKRMIKNSSTPTNEQMISDYINKKILPTEEEVEIVINYEFM